MNADLTAKCAYIFKKLNAEQVKSVSVSFSGGGDDGTLEISDWDTIDKTHVYDPMDEITPFVTYTGSNTKLTIYELISNISEEVLCLYDVDYCNNNGNEGYIFFDIENGKIETQYRNYTSVTESLYI
jgi:hypothetical protein